MFRESFAGTPLFVMENTTSEGVIEWPAVSDPALGSQRIETAMTKAEAKLGGKQVKGYFCFPICDP